LSFHTNYVVNRVHWLRARAQKQRWEEELILVGYEMAWTVNYYKHQSAIWIERKVAAFKLGDSGAAAYSYCKVAMWMDMASNADKEFREVNPSYQLNNK